jgi:hypothetical protein
LPLLEVTSETTSESQNSQITETSKARSKQSPSTIVIEWGSKEKRKILQP